MLLGLAAGAVPGPAAGQVPDTVRQGPPRMPPPQDTAAQPPLGQDTLGVAPDTTLPPPTPLPDLAERSPAGWAEGVYEWDRYALLRLPDASLLHLLERVPGLVPVRADIVGQPEGAALFGAAAGAIRYVVDGFVMDPLTSPTFDPSRLSLLALDHVRVERGVTGATVRIRTLTPDRGQPESVIEAATGDYGVNAFRGMFLPPRMLGGALGLGFERLSADGFTPGRANHTVTWLKWTWVRDGAGVQAELRQRKAERDGVGDGLSGNRTDWVVRARQALGPVTAELYVGATTMEDQVGGEFGDVVREGTPQGGLRVAGRLPVVPGEAWTAVRFRDHPRLPAREVEVGVQSSPVPWLTVEGEAVQGWWTERGPTGRWSARTLLGPILGIRPFAAVFRGGPLAGRGAELALPAPDSGAFQRTRDGLRAGAELQLGGLEIGGAMVRVSADTAFGFGLAMEPVWSGAPGAVASGYEARVRIPTGFDPFSLRGWFVQMDVPTGWLYLPARHWRAGLVYHHVPLATGNLEIFARIEHVYRGGMNVPGTGGVTRVDAYRATNAELTIRVLTVRAFLRWDNMFHRLGQRDLPDFRRPGQHILWGVKWEFLN